MTGDDIELKHRQCCLTSLQKNENDWYFWNKEEERQVKTIEGLYPVQSKYKFDELNEYNNSSMLYW